MLVSRLFAAVLALPALGAYAQDSGYGYIPPDYISTTNPPTPIFNGYPWGTKNANNTNPYVNPPHTGVVRTYNFTLTRVTFAPDGYSRAGILINGVFPGPLIEANWGDTIQVTVNNQITNPQEGTTIHWHGMLQKNTQWMDGVEGITQCPIAPGKSMTYTFTADLFGTTWYHSHLSAQYSDGVVGPMIIHGPTTVQYDLDIGPVFLSDWYHRPYQHIVNDVLSSDITKLINGVTSDNNLIQGRNTYDCSQKAPTDTNNCVSDASLATFQLQPDKVHRLRLINAGAEGTQKFTIDNHVMTVIANDFVPIIPYNTTVITLGIGQRTDILIKGLPASSNPGAYYMRASIASDPCSSSKNPNALATVYYDRDKSFQPIPSKPYPAFIASLGVCANDDLSKTEPWFQYPAVQAPSFTQVLDINFIMTEMGYRFTVNGQSWNPNDTMPLLNAAVDGQVTFPDGSQTNVYNTGTAATYRIHLRNPGFLAHPIHLHGHNFQVLAAGVGTWDGTIPHANNPQRRDVQIMPAGGYLVIQIDTDNPGVWKLHCHIDWHLAEGFSISIIERPNDIEKLSVPAAMQQVCDDWLAYDNLPDAAGCPNDNGNNITSSNGDTYTLACNTNLGGTDLAQKQTTTFEQCLTFCSQTKGCVNAVWGSIENPAPALRWCWAKSPGAPNPQMGIMSAPLAKKKGSAASSSAVPTKAGTTAKPTTTTKPTTTAKATTSQGTMLQRTSTAAKPSTSSIPGTGAVALPLPIISANCPGNNGATLIDNSSGSTYKLSCNTNYGGSDLASDSFKTLEECMALCSRTNGCVSAVWAGTTNPSTQGKGCWVKSGTDAKSQSGRYGLLLVKKGKKRHLGVRAAHVLLK